MNLDKTICTCMGVTNGMIQKAVYDGANTLEDIQEITTAGTCCGACLEELLHLIDFFVKERDK